MILNTVVFVCFYLLVCLLGTSLVWILLFDLIKARVATRKMRRLNKLSKEFFDIYNQRNECLARCDYVASRKKCQGWLKREVQAGLRCLSVCTEDFRRDLFIRYVTNALEQIKDQEFVRRYRVEFEKTKRNSEVRSC